MAYVLRSTAVYIEWVSRARASHVRHTYTTLPALAGAPAHSMCTACSASSVTIFHNHSRSAPPPSPGRNRPSVLARLVDKRRLRVQLRDWPGAHTHTHNTLAIVGQTCANMCVVRRVFFRLCMLMLLCNVHSVSTEYADGDFSSGRPNNY